MPPISRGYRAVAAVEVPVVRIRVAVVVASTNDQCVATRVTDAMRPGIVRSDRYAPRRAALSGKDQTVIAGCGAGIDFWHEAEKLSRLRILQYQSAALLLIGCCGAGGIAGAIERARPQSQEDGRIVLLGGPQMRAVIS